MRNLSKVASQLQLLLRLRFCSLGFPILVLLRLLIPWTLNSQAPNIKIITYCDNDINLRGSALVPHAPWEQDLPQSYHTRR
jgi:hypothetical protein